MSMSAAITRPFPALSGAPKAPWLRFLEGDGTDTPGSTPGTGTPAGEQQPKPTGDGKPPAQEDNKTDWKAEARKWEQRAKENNKAAERLKEIEDAEKSELEKEREKREAAERKVQEFEAKETRRELAEKVAREKRVPVQLLMRGGGDTEEDMRSYADDILAFKPEKPGVVPNSGTNGAGKEEATSSVAAGRERFEARRKKNQS
jgi:hypothetical protein